MNSSRARSGVWRVAAWVALAAALPCTGEHARAQDNYSDPGWHDVSLAAYRQHLLDLDALVAGCQKQVAAQKAAPSGASHGSPNPDACDPRSVGPNDRVAQPGGAGSQPREVRYDWLRNVLSIAGHHGPAAQPTVLGALPKTRNQPQDVDALLADARRRLEDDAKLAAQPAPAPWDESESYAAQHKALNAILAQRAYQHANETSARDRILEWIDNLLDKLFASLMRIGLRSPWIVFVLRILILGGICVALIWFLLRIEWRSRVRLVPDDVPAPGAPSARDWQLWYQDAAAMAAKHQWREAIHFLYWAVISLLESRRLWPADRARTPREYLGLLASADERKPSLTALTRSFERTWYGGRAAAASDFQAALDLVRALGLEVGKE